MSVAFSTGMTVFTDPSPGISANQELPSSAVWSGLGARVLVVDYIGLGTPGIHTFANRIEGAHAVLDAARAANALAGVEADAPVVFWGYSQGGGATAAAAEMQPTYAPELNLKGTWAGGPVADLAAILERIDGALIGGVVGSSRPATPVLITSGRNDDTVPYGRLGSWRWIGARRGRRSPSAPTNCRRSCRARPFRRISGRSSSKDSVPTTPSPTCWIASRTSRSPGARWLDRPRSGRSVVGHGPPPSDS